VQQAQAQQQQQPSLDTLREQALRRAVARPEGWKGTVGDVLTSLSGTNPNLQRAGAIQAYQANENAQNESKLRQIGGLLNVTKSIADFGQQIEDPALRQKYIDTLAGPLSALSGAHADHSDHTAYMDKDFIAGLINQPGGVSKYAAMLPFFRPEDHTQISQGRNYEEKMKIAEQVSNTRGAKYLQLVDTYLPEVANAIKQQSGITGRDLTLAEAKAGIRKALPALIASHPELANDPGAGLHLASAADMYLNNSANDKQVASAGIEPGSIALTKQQLAAQQATKGPDASDPFIQQAAASRGHVMGDFAPGQSLDIKTPAGQAEWQRVVADSNTLRQNRITETTTAQKNAAKEVDLDSTIVGKDAANFYDREQFLNSGDLVAASGSFTKRDTAPGGKYVYIDPKVTATYQDTLRAKGLADDYRRVASNLITASNPMSAIGQGMKLSAATHGIGNAQDIARAKAWKSASEAFQPVFLAAIGGFKRFNRPEILALADASGDVYDTRDALELKLAIRDDIVNTTLRAQRLRIAGGDTSQLESQVATKLQQLGRVHESSNYAKAVADGALDPDKQTLFTDGSRYSIGPSGAPAPAGFHEVARPQGVSRPQNVRQSPAPQVDRAPGGRFRQ
jgi:hypothetical protein